MPARIAIVDDSAVALAWAKQHLIEKGFDVVTYDAGLGIQSFVRDTQPHLLLLDVHMPALHGDIVCKMLKSKPATSSVAVFLYSSLPEDELKKRAMACGADGYIAKTRDPAVLTERVHAALHFS